MAGTLQQFRSLMMSKLLEVNLTMLAVIGDSNLEFSSCRPHAKSTTNISRINPFKGAALDLHDFKLLMCSLSEE